MAAGEEAEWAEGASDSDLSPKTDSANCTGSPEAKVTLQSHPTPYPGKTHRSLYVGCPGKELDFCEVFLRS